MEELDRRVGEARALVAERRWGEAALAWVRAAQRSGELGHGDAARQCWDAAGEAWRRDDQPRAAARALRLALDLAGGDPALAAVSRVKLAGTLGELGNAEASVDLCRRVAEEVAEGPIHLMAVDTWVGSLQSLGDVHAMRPLVAELAAVRGGPFGAAGLFRSGQLHRLDGDLVTAAEDFALVVAELEGEPGADAGLAAAECELAEVAALRGDLEDALELFARAVRRHEDAGRRALMWRAEAGRIRAVVGGGMQALVHSLDEGVALAVERGMVLLEVDLLLARGIALSRSDPARAESDLRRALSAAEAHRSPLRAGRARLALVTGLAPPDGLELACAAVAALEVSAPWHARARLALARLQLADEPALTRMEAVALAARFASMGMERDAREARDLARGAS